MTPRESELATQLKATEDKVAFLMREVAVLKNDLANVCDDRNAFEKGRDEGAAQCAALREALRIQDPRNATECFERMASDFRKETGLMAPGKDVHPARSYGDEDEDRRRKLWRPFVNAWHERFFDAALASTSDAAARWREAVRREALEEKPPCAKHMHSANACQAFADGRYSGLEEAAKEAMHAGHNVDMAPDAYGERVGVTVRCDAPSRIRALSRQEPEEGKP